MTFVLLAIVAVLAALVGYVVGSRRGSGSATAPPPAVGGDSPPAIAARDAPLGQLAELAHERERLFHDLADARTDAARYRQVIVDIENNAPPPILAGVGEPDDLKLIVGVGPVLERMLHNLGITTFRQIARWTDREVSEFDARLPEFPGRIQRDQWVTQARALHRSKYGQSATGAPAGG
ncbi:MAG TPA: hypothetical protein VMN79_10800 [Casimicrobiaceae bacterium]|nr:hypothetical protein [Casimicrobiaceae bacterium]